MNRAGRSKDVTDYVEERWPGLNAFAADFPMDGSGHGVMAALALAYSRAGNLEKFEEALSFVERAKTELTEQGVNQFVFMMENAKYFTLTGNHDAALEWLEKAVNQGLQIHSPLAVVIPMFEALQEDTRFLEIEATMIANINEDRAALGLDPVDPYMEFWQ